MTRKRVIEEECADGTTETRELEASWDFAQSLCLMFRNRRGSAPRICRATGEPGELISHMESVIRSRAFACLRIAFWRSNGASQGWNNCRPPDLSPAEMFRVLVHETAMRCCIRASEERRRAKRFENLKLRRWPHRVIKLRHRFNDEIIGLHSLYSGDKEMLIVSLEHNQKTATPSSKNCTCRKRRLPMRWHLECSTVVKGKTVSAHSMRRLAWSSELPNGIIVLGDEALLGGALPAKPRLWSGSDGMTKPSLRSCVSTGSRVDYRNASPR